jgi:PEP-CTERM motif
LKLRSAVGDRGNNYENLNTFKGFRTMRRRSLPWLIIAVVALSAWPATCRAGIIVSVDATPATIARGLGGAFQDAVGVSWTMNQAYTNVTIAAAIASANAGDTATAYLTTAAGPGTTTADVVAVDKFTMPVFLPLRSAPDFTLFTGLSLQAGTYYLIVTTPFDTSEARGWRGTSGTPGITLAPGVTLNSSIDSGDGNGDPSFAPDSHFSTSATYYQFSVTGTVPEPSSLALLATGLAASLGLSRWRATHEHRSGNRLANQS